MKKTVNILFALLFVASVVLTGCSKEAPLTPHNGDENLELRGGDDDGKGDNNDKNNGGITDPGDDDDDEGGSTVLSKD